MHLAIARNALWHRLLATTVSQRTIDADKVMPANIIHRSTIHYRYYNDTANSML